MSKPTPVTVVLPANASFALRTATWARVTKDGYKCAGILTITETNPGSRRVITNTYAVLELDPAPDGRRFQLSKPGMESLDSEDGRYWLQLRPTGKGFTVCTCRGCEAQGRCKHTQSIEALAVAGHLPPPRIPVKS